MTQQKGGGVVVAPQHRHTYRHNKSRFNFWISEEIVRLLDDAVRWHNEKSFMRASRSSIVEECVIMQLREKKQWKARRLAEIDNKIKTLDKERETIVEELS